MFRGFRLVRVLNGIVVVCRFHDGRDLLPAIPPRSLVDNVEYH